MSIGLKGIADEIIHDIEKMTDEEIIKEVNDVRKQLGFDKCLHLCNYCDIYPLEFITENNCQNIEKRSCKCCSNIVMCKSFEPNSEYFDELERRD